MKKFKWLSAFLILLLGSLLLFACSEDGEGDEEVGSSEDDEVIEFMHLWPEGSSAQHYRIVNEIIEDFEEEHPNKTVDLQVYSNEQYKDQITVLSSANELPDVGMTWAAGYMEPFVSGNMFAELDDMLDEGLRDEFVAGTLEAFELDGVSYGLPLELNTTYVFYNKNIFDEHGLEKPDTYEDLQEIISVLNENNVEPISLGNRDRWTGSMWYMYFADRIGGSDVLTEAINGERSFEDPALVEAAEKVQEMVTNDSFNSGFNGMANEEASSMFMNDQAAMYMIATWDLPNFTTNEDIPQEFRDSVDYFKFPTVEGSGDTNSFVGGPGVGLFVSENSEVKDAALEFSSFFIQEWGERSVTEAGVIPGTIVDGESLDLPDMYVEVLEDLENATNLTLYADVQMSAGVADRHLELIQALFGLEITAEEFAEEHENALSEE
ncbi:extracellular solute-binding protein [Alkalibacillus haloalkaliphilus]|uniref:ABC transporter substrate-binding protein n=1 Tax=Alkalibacillus haloalkaliphilus TaxID=94136 RepID=A0A511W5M2_9BACI|nr:extracellular solute-binding protein [Alkalibacillus haloalkaliphilus]GEN46061.1 hypothetical protein AHA02nite_18370 [Alkalibacillus haloalkaliphilus]